MKCKCLQLSASGPWLLFLFFCGHYYYCNCIIVIAIVVACSEWKSNKRGQLWCAFWTFDAQTHKWVVKKTYIYTCIYVNKCTIMPIYFTYKLRAYLHTTFLFVYIYSYNIFLFLFVYNTFSLSSVLLYAIFCMDLFFSKQCHLQLIALLNMVEILNIIIGNKNEIPKKNHKKAQFKTQMKTKSTTGRQINIESCALVSCEITNLKIKPQQRQPRF